MLKAKRVDTGRYTVSVEGKNYELVLDEGTKQWKIVVVTRQTARERFTKKKKLWLSLNVEPMGKVMYIRLLIYALLWLIWCGFVFWFLGV